MSCGGQLPAEILGKLFDLVGEEDIVSCSGVNLNWHGAARRELLRKFGVQLCRRPTRISSKSRDVYLAGDAVEQFTRRKLRKLKSLRIRFDEPGNLRATILSAIFSSCKNLGRLELLNLTDLSPNCAEVILEKCNPGLTLRMSLFNGAESKDALDILVEHRELFQELTVTRPLAVVGWFPIPGATAGFSCPENVRSVSLECLGLTNLEFPVVNNLTTLRLSKCHRLTDASWDKMSRLPITELSLRGCSTGESTLLNCFKFGFSDLTTISLLGCTNLSAAVIEVICSKQLTAVTLEINKSAEIPGLTHLHKCNEIEYLRIVTDQIKSNAVSLGVERHWPRMKFLEIEENTLQYDESMRHSTMIGDLCSLKRIEFVYISNPTKITDASSY